MPACEREVQVGPYYDGELSDADRRAFEAHLAGCAECARQLAGLETLSRYLGPARAMILPESERQRLHDLAEAVARGGTSPAADGPAFAQYDAEQDDATEEQQPNPMRIGPARSVRWVRWLTAAAAAVFLFSVVQLFLTHRGDPRTSPGGDRPGGIPAIHPGTTAPGEAINGKKAAVKQATPQPPDEGPP
jgi:anti-sigma factor RsiW